MAKKFYINKTSEEITGLDTSQLGENKLVTHKKFCDAINDGYKYTSTIEYNETQFIYEDELNQIEYSNKSITSFISNTQPITTTYNAQEQSAVFYISKDGDKQLQQNVDFTVTGNNVTVTTDNSNYSAKILIKGTNAETYTVKIAGIGHYEDSVTLNFVIDKADINNTTITVTDNDVIYNGKTQKPTITIKFNGNNNVTESNYTVNYTYNINSGTSTTDAPTNAYAYTVKITGKGNFKNTKNNAGTFTINYLDLSKCELFFGYQYSSNIGNKMSETNKNVNDAIIFDTHDIGEHYSEPWEPIFKVVYTNGGQLSPTNSQAFIISEDCYKYVNSNTVKNGYWYVNEPGKYTITVTPPGNSNNVINSQIGYFYILDSIKSLENIYIVQANNNYVNSGSKRINYTQAISSAISSVSYQNIVIDPTTSGTDYCNEAFIFIYEWSLCYSSSPYYTTNDTAKTSANFDTYIYFNENTTTYPKITATQKSQNAISINLTPTNSTTSWINSYDVNHVYRVEYTWDTVNHRAANTDITITPQYGTYPNYYDFSVNKIFNVQISPDYVYPNPT